MKTEESTLTDKTNTYFQALEQANNEAPLNGGQHRAYIAWLNSLRNQSSTFEADDLPWPRDIHDFVETLRAAGITEFAVTDRSTGLMEGLHGLARMLKEAKETFLEDPMVQNDFFIGSGMLTIAFE